MNRYIGPWVDPRWKCTHDGWTAPFVWAGRLPDRIRRFLRRP